MRFRTVNSTYEVEYDPGVVDSPATGRVRRLGGENDPTPRQGPDGVWKAFMAITAIRPGDCVTIIWKIDDVEDFSIARTTITSEILWVETDDA